MNVLINKRFLKDLSALPKGDRRKIEEFAFKESEKLASIESAGDVYFRVDVHFGG